MCEKAILHSCAVFHSPAAHKNMATHSCNIQPYCLLIHQIIYIYHRRDACMGMGNFHTFQPSPQYSVHKHKLVSHSHTPFWMLCCDWSSLVPRLLCVDGEKRGWYTLFANAQFSQFSQDFAQEPGNEAMIGPALYISSREGSLVLNWCLLAENADCCILI